MANYFNATMRNIEYRLRAFKKDLPDHIRNIIDNKDSVIVSAIADDQLFRRGINGRGEKIMDYAPYTERTKAIKRKKGQPTTRVTLKDTGSFHLLMVVICEQDGFYVTSGDRKTQELVEKYGEEIFRLTDENFTRIIKSHVRKELVKRLKQAVLKR